MKAFPRGLERSKIFAHSHRSPSGRLGGKYVEALARAILQPLLNEPLGFFSTHFPPSDSEQLYARAVLFLQIAPIQLEATRASCIGLDTPLAKSCGKTTTLLVIGAANSCAFSSPLVPTAINPFKNLLIISISIKPGRTATGRWGRQGGQPKKPCFERRQTTTSKWGIAQFFDEFDWNTMQG